MLSCDLHDYLEIMCLFQYEVEVTLKDDVTAKGRASDVGLNASRQEVLKLAIGNEIQELPTTEIKLIQVLTADARFKQVVFSE